MLSVFLLLLFFPVVARAQSYDISSLAGVYPAVAGIINTIFPAVVGIAVFAVAWGIFKFILNAGDPEARKQGMATILWGVVGVFLMFSIWGLVNILKNTFKFDTTPVVPQSLLPPS